MDIYNQLKRPFDPSLISWRVGATNKEKTKGIALAYIDARDVMNRLDEVFGMGWQCKYSHAENKTICEISVIVDGVWITRAGGAGDTDVEAEKGAISDAFKRAAVLFGIGRYLYELPNVWVPIDEYKKLKSHPQLPAWATPEGFDAILNKDKVQPPRESAKSIAKSVWDELEPEEQNFLNDIAMEMIAFLTGKITEVDLKEAHRLFYGNNLDQQQQTALWSRLDSKQRRAIKDYNDQQKKAA